MAWPFLSKGSHMDAYTVVMLLVLFAMSATCVVAIVKESRIAGAISLALAAVWVLMMGGW